MPATLNPPKLRRRIDLGTPADDDQDQPAPQPPLSDAQAADLNQGPAGLSLSSGYTAMPTAPTGVMGGDQTQPDDFGQKVQAATAVESKGGPPLSELSAKAGKGPVNLKPPAKEDKTPPPETKPQPTPATDIAPKATVPGSPPPVKPAQPVASPSPSPSPATAAPSPSPSPAPGQPATPATPDQSTLPPSLQDPAMKAALQKYGNPQALGKNQDYNGLPPEVTQNPDFAGLSPSGEPVYFDRTRNEFYMKDDTAPGKELRHYQNAKYGTPEWNGVEHTDPEQEKMYQEASDKLGGILKAKDAIQDYRAQAAKFQAMHGNINWMQAQELAAQNNPEAAWWQKLLAYGGGAMKGTPLEINNQMVALDQARQKLSTTAALGIMGGTPAREAMRYAPPIPDVTDPLDRQLQKTDTLEKYIDSEINAVYSQNPRIARFLRQAQENQRKARASGLSGNTTAAPATPAASPSPSPSPAATPEATPGAPTYEEAQAAPRIKSHADLEGKKKGYLYRDTDGTLKRLGY